MDFGIRADFTVKAKSLDPTILHVYADGEYIVEKHSVSEDSYFQCRLMIKRLDNEPMRSWRVLQDIKNSMVGLESEAIEIYPKESEVTDTGSLYHLWVFQPGVSANVKLVPPSCSSTALRYDKPSVPRKVKKTQRDSPINRKGLTFRMHHSGKLCGT